MFDGLQNPISFQISEMDFDHETRLKGSVSDEIFFKSAIKALDHLWMLWQNLESEDKWDHPFPFDEYNHLLKQVRSFDFTSSSI
jgi:hypothetical protein